jgi:chromatin structure-remodeling complex subunit SFH1
MTTYPSRVKLGLTTLMQPLSDNGKVEPANAQASAGSSSSSSSSAAALLKRGNKAEEENSSKRSKSVLEATPTVLGKRQRNRVDYRERIDIPEPPSSSGGSEDEGDENDTSKQREGSTDAVMEDDSKLSRAARAAKRNGVLPPAAASARDSPAPIAEKDKKAAKQPDANTANVGKSWLAQNPPANLIMVQPAKRHMLPYV